MDIITKKATEFCDFYFHSDPQAESILTKARKIFNSFDNKLDRIKFIKIILERNASDYEKHKAICSSPENCDINDAYDEISYYFFQELNRLGIKTDNNVFTIEEKIICDNKLDEILASIQILKDGQEIIFNEIDELKNLYFLGKKNWKEIFIGKFTEMVIAGIISETASKDILDWILNMPDLPNLLV